MGSVRSRRPSSRRLVPGCSVTARSTLACGLLSPSRRSSPPRRPGPPDACGRGGSRDPPRARCRRGSPAEVDPSWMAAWMPMSISDAGSRGPTVLPFVVITTIHGEPTARGASAGGHASESAADQASRSVPRGVASSAAARADPRARHRSPADSRTRAPTRTIAATATRRAERPSRSRSRPASPRCSRIDALVVVARTRRGGRFVFCRIGSPFDAGWLALSLERRRPAAGVTSGPRSRFEAVQGTNAANRRTLLPCPSPPPSSASTRPSTCAPTGASGIG